MIMCLAAQQLFEISVVSLLSQAHAGMDMSIFRCILNTSAPFFILWIGHDPADLDSTTWEELAS